MIKIYCRIYFLIFCFFCQTIHGEEFGWDIFEESAIESNSFSSTQGLLSSIVANHVGIISGEFVDQATDCVLAGPEPLALQRFYSAHPSVGMFGFEAVPLDPNAWIEVGSKYCGWQFNHLTNLYFQTDLRKHAKDEYGELNAFVPHAYFSQMLHRNLIKVPKGEYKQKDCQLRLFHQKGVTNCSSGALSGRTNPKNVVASLSDKHTSCNVRFGSGNFRHYEGGFRDGTQWGDMGIWKFSPKYEQKANGNQIIYQDKEDKEVYAYNSSKSTLYSWLKISRISNEEWQVKTSHSNEPIIYGYSPHEVMKTRKHDYKTHYYLTSLISPDQPKETYEYTLNADKEGWLLCRKERPDQRFLEIEYYGIGDQPGKKDKYPITHELDPRANRVKCLKAPVGTNAKPITTHHFFYDLNSKINKSKKVSTYEGVTTVYDAYRRKSVYVYNEHHRLTNFVQYLNKKPYLQTCYLWDEGDAKKESSSNSVSAYTSPNQGNLMGKFIQNREGNILLARFFEYDKSGNILKENVYGNLTGTNETPIELDETLYPIDNGTEYYQREFSYSNDSLNLLLEENEPTGRKIRYTYYPEKDLIASKFLLDHDRICVRKFYEYDKNNAMTTVIYDNGSGIQKNDLTNVTERHLVRYSPRKTIPVGLPEQIDEMILLDSGKEQLLKKTLQSYSQDGKLLKREIYDANGKYCYALEWEYDTHGNVIKEVNALGHVTTKKYDENDNLIREQGPCPDFRLKHVYDFANRRIATKEIHTNGNRFVTHYRYDLIGNCIAKVDRYGNETKYEYDDLNRLVATTYPAVNKISATTKCAYDWLGNCTEETDALNQVTEKSYNARGKVTSIRLPDGQLETFEYYLDGTLAKKVASNKTKTHFEVDSFKRILSEKCYAETGELLYETHNTYDSLHKTSSTDPSGLTTYFYYDRAGRISKTICQDKIELYEYDSLGRLAKKKEPFESKKMKVTCTQYDFLNRVTEERIEDEQGRILKKVNYQYDLLGNRTHVIEETQAGLSQHVTLYNSDNKPMTIIDPEGNKTHLTYHYNVPNEEGQFVLQSMTTDPLGRQTIVTHDALERPISVKKLDSLGLLLAHQEMTHDAQGNITSLFDHVIVQGKKIRSIETTFAYQETGKLTRLTQANKQPEQQITETIYNKFGQKKRVIKSGGTIVRYSYDGLGRLITQRSNDHSISYCYTYNANHQILKVEDLIQKTSSEFTYDARGRLLTEKLANEIPISYEYDLLDRVTALILPDSSRIHYRYDAANLKEIERIKGQKSLYTHRYNAFDLAGLNLKATAIHQQEIAYAYDLLKRPLAAETKLCKQQGAQYDRAGRLCQYDWQDPVGPLKVSYTYDDHDHLIGEEGHLPHTYACDSLHNRIAKDRTTYTLNALNQLMNAGNESYTYDKRGNLKTKKAAQKTTTYRYDAEDRLVAIKEDQETRYLYDAFHRRIAKIEGNKTTRYFYVGQDEIGSMDEKGNIQELRILGLGQGAEIGASIAIELQDRVFVPYHDFRGNITCLADLKNQPVETYRYNAFGETTIYNAKGKAIASSEIGNPWQFSSKRCDAESGLVYFGRRYYDASIGRWLTADPAGFVDGPNLYAYLHHRPTQGFDLYGLYQEEGAGQAQGQQQPYYPLDNVDPNDSSGSGQATEDVNPNEAPLGFVEKKNGKKSSTYFCGDHQVPNIYITRVNGIMNNLMDAQSSAQTLSQMAGDQFVIYVYNRSTGFLLSDLTRCGLQFNGCLMQASKDLAEVWRTCSEKKCLIYHECVSEGAFVTKRALEITPPEIRSNISLLGISPACYIPDSYAGHVLHVRSSRDFVPWFDAVGAYKCRHSTITIKPDPNASLLDHSGDSRTFSDIRQRNFNNFMQRARERFQCN